VSVEHIVNFSLMARGEPFPYDRLHGQDLVVFTPILNRAAYNTDGLVEFCAARNIPCVAFTWLQWNGYFPGFSTAKFDWYDGWWCKALADIAPSHASFESFLDAVEGGEALAGLVEPALQHATTVLKARERKGAVDIAISGFVLDNFRTERLFLTPTHPTPALYGYVFRRLEQLTSLRLRSEYYDSPQGPPHNNEVPIFPVVRRALGLSFDGGAFAHDKYWGDRRFSLREFTRMHYEPETMRRLTRRHAPAVTAPRRRAWLPSRLVRGARRWLTAPASPPG
jgi:hypothetical protein